MQAEVQEHGEQIYGCIGGISFSAERRRQTQLLEEDNALYLIVWPTSMGRLKYCSAPWACIPGFAHSSGVGDSNLRLLRSCASFSCCDSNIASRGADDPMNRASSSTTIYLFVCQPVVVKELTVETDLVIPRLSGLCEVNPTAFGTTCRARVGTSFVSVHECNHFRSMVISSESADLMSSGY